MVILTFGENVKCPFLNYNEILKINIIRKLVNLPMKNQYRKTFKFKSSYKLLINVTFQQTLF